MTTDDRRLKRGLSSSSMRPLVSLIVVTYHSMGLLPAFFAALDATDYAPYEVLLVDAARDGALCYLAEAQPQARVLANREDVGFERTCNQGAVAARFNERNFLYGEDTDLCCRAWLLGWRVLADLQAQVYRMCGSSGGHGDAGQTKRSPYVYLKLMRWQRVMLFATLLTIKTLAKQVLRREDGLLAGWVCNITHLRVILVDRRLVVPTDLECMIDARSAVQARNLPARCRIARGGPKGGVLS